MSKSNSKLSVKQELFVTEYIRNKGNATQAAIKAGYSEKTARSQGQRLLTNVDIKNEIKRRLKSKTSKKVAQADEVLELLTKFARGQAKEEQIVVEGTGDGFSSARIMKRKIALRERLSALDKLARIHGLYNDKVEISASKETNDLLKNIIEQFDMRRNNEELKEIDNLEE